MRPDIKLHLRSAHRGAALAIGPGKVALLEAIGQTGSISAAAKVLGMSYRRAWDLVDETNRCLVRAAVRTPPARPRAAPRSPTGKARAPLSQLERRTKPREVSLLRSVPARASAVRREAATTSRPSARAAHVKSAADVARRRHSECRPLVMAFFAIALYRSAAPAPSRASVSARSSRASVASIPRTQCASKLAIRRREARLSAVDDRGP